MRVKTTAGLVRRSCSETTTAARKLCSMLALDLLLGTAAADAGGSASGDSRSVSSDAALVDPTTVAEVIDGDGAAEDGESGAAR